MTHGQGPILSVDISVDYPQKPGVLRGTCIDVCPGEVLGLVGQSGSGKSTLTLAILGLLSHTGAKITGRAELLGNNLLTLGERQMRGVRGRLVSLIPQSPAAALNPALRLETQIREAWRAHSKEPWPGQRRHVLSLMESVGLAPDEAFLRRFPAQISVGQAQRVLLVMALLHEPPLLIADEPTSSLDLITQRDVLQLLSRLGPEHNTSVLFISHDLLAVAAISSRIAILHDGKIVESGPVAEVLREPRNAYTRQLVAAAPKWSVEG